VHTTVHAFDTVVLLVLEMGLKMKLMDSTTVLEFDTVVLKLTGS